jgi:tetratricopeptide (TPR) repeat protein
MLRLKTVRFAPATALAAALVCAAAAQTEDFARRLAAGQQLRARDRFDDARTAFRDLLRDVRKENSDPRIEALVLDNLALDEQDSGDYPAAETAFNHGLAAFHTNHTADPTAIALKTHLAELYIAEVRSEDAEPLLRQAVETLRSSPLPDPMALSTAEEDLAVVSIMRRKFEEPETLLRHSQALVENTLGPDSPRLTASLLTYAGLLTAEHRYAEAVAPAERAWRILCHSASPVPKPYRASALSVLGAVYFHTGRLAEAESSARQSVELADQSLGPQHPRLGLYLLNYATILKQAGHKSDAKAVQKRADEIINQYPAAGSGYTVNVASLR